MVAKPKPSRRTAAKKPHGRPTGYRPEYCEMARKLCLLQSTDLQIADFLGIAEKTLYLWKAKYPKFAQSIRDGKLKADAEIAKSIYRRALGYSHPEVHVSNYQGKITKTKLVKYYPPDTPAAIFWLKNRHPDKWRDQQDLKHSGAVSIGEVLDLP